MNWRWPQITMLILMAMDLGTNLTNDGQSHTETYNFGISIAAFLISGGLLYAGGFWRGGQ